MNLEHVPFVGSETDCEVLSTSFAESKMIRIPLRIWQKLKGRLPTSAKLWIDSEVDGFDSWETRTREFRQHFGERHDVIALSEPSFQVSPQKATVRKIVDDLLNRSLDAEPEWLSVPQLPHVEHSSRNKINRILAEMAREWVVKTHYRGQLILPVIFTHQSQTKLKTTRAAKVELVCKCIDLSGASGCWIADSSLNDQEGSRTLEHTRLPSLIGFHQMLVDARARGVFIIAGPYWGLNLVLWARGLIEYPAIGLGNRFRYHLAGGQLAQGKTRIALGALRRLAEAQPDLKMWLGDALKQIPLDDPAHLEFANISAQFTQFLRISKAGRFQVAKVYRQWIDSIASMPPNARSLTLYQQLSSAYVLGKALPELPEDGSARRPERVAQQLMMVCL